MAHNSPAFLLYLFHRVQWWHILRFDLFFFALATTLPSNLTRKNETSISGGGGGICLKMVPTCPGLCSKLSQHPALALTQLHPIRLRLLPPFCITPFGIFPIIASSLVAPPLSILPECNTCFLWIQVRPRPFPLSRPLFPHPFYPLPQVLRSVVPIPYPPPPFPPISNERCSPGGPQLTIVDV